MTWIGSTVALSIAVTVGLGACSGGSEGDSACASISIFEGRSYVGTVVQWAVVDSSRLGEALSPSCDDGYGPSEEYTQQVWSIEGVDPEEAIAVEVGDGASVYIAEDVDDPSPELKRILDADQ